MSTEKPNYFLSRSEADTEELGAALASELEPGSVVLLYGDLGAGKTVFSRGFARGLGVTEPVSSPTYTIVQEYTLSTGGRLYHMDLYRISDEHAALGFGVDEFLNEPGAISLVEWPDRIRGLLPDTAIRVELRHRTETEREIVITPPLLKSPPASRRSSGGNPWRVNVPWLYMLAIIICVFGVEGSLVFTASRIGKMLHPLLWETIFQISGFGIALLLFALVPPRGGLFEKLGVRHIRFGDLGIALAGLGMIYAWQLLATPLWDKVLHALEISCETRQSLLAECDNASLPYFLALLALAGVLIPIVEELMFRRLLFGLLRPIGTVAAMLATALIFAAAHGFLYGLPALLGLGLVFQWQYLHTGNLLTPMMTHIIYNCISLTLVFMLGNA